MARLPDVDSLGARPVPTARRSIATVRNAGAVADAAGDLGASVTQIAEQRLEREDKLSYAAAKTAFLAADIEARQELQNDPDYATYEQRYNERMGKAREAASKLLGSRMDRRTFDVDVQLDLARGAGEVRQLVRQKRVAADSATGTDTLDQQRTLLRNAPDEKTREAVILAANENIQGMVAKGVIDPIKAIELRRGFISGAVRTRVSVALDNGDHAAAREELEKGSPFLDDDTYIKLHAAIDEAADESEVMDAASVGMAAPDTISGSGDMSRMVEITLHSESRGRRFDKDGTVLTSAKGARGEMQVMPGTERDPGFGVRPMQDNSHEERARVGRDYLAAMLTRYGSPDKAWAAYNGGPGAVDAAMAKAEKAGKPWLSFMPAETRKYVATNMAMLNRGGQTKPQTMEEAIARGVAALGPNADPKAVASVRREINTRWSIAKDAEQERDNTATESVQDLLVKNGGDWYALPASVRATVPAKLHGNMIAFGRSLKLGEDDRKSDPVAYVKLTELAARDAKAFTKINPIAYFDKLDRPDWERLVAMRNGIIEDGIKNPAYVTDNKIMEVTGNRLSAAGILTGDSKEAQKQAPRVAQYQRHMRSWAEAFERQNGRPPNEEEIAKKADKALIDVRFDGDDMLAFETPDLASSKIVVPGDIAKRIRNEAGRDLTSQEVAAVYVHFKGRKW